MLLKTWRDYVSCELKREYYIEIITGKRAMFENENNHQGGKNVTRMI